jgi:hypothetical protein
MEISLRAEVLEFTPDPVRLEADPQPIYRALGYRTSSPAPMVTELVEEILQAAIPMLAPRCTVALLPEEGLVFDKSSFTCAGVTFHTEPIITKRIRKSTRIALFVCSLGPGIEEWSKQELSGGDLLKGYTVDAAASTFVESAADWMERELENFISPRGWKQTNRYSPGYCDWSVREQQKIFSFFPPLPSGVMLTESSLMIPIKSVSGIIGLGPDVEREEYECKLCDLKDCFQRRLS